MPSKELIEKVARAIYERRHKGMANIWSWDDHGLDDEHPGERERYIGYAQAAISTTRAAIADADTAMLQAAQDAWLADPCRKSSTLWRAMLAASALGEQSE